MKKQMTIADLIDAQACSFDGFSKEEIASAYEDLVMHQHEFESNTESGDYLRQEVFKHFKEDHPECSTVEELAIHADLEDDSAAKFVCQVKLDAEAYASSIANP